MSEGRFSTPPLAPEDDWFAEPDEWSPAEQAPPRPRPRSAAEPRARRPEQRRARRRESRPDRRLLAAALAGAVLLLVGGVVAAFAVTGSDGGGEPTATPPTTAPTTTTPPTTTTTTTTTTETSTTSTTTSPTGVPSGVVLRPGDESEEVRKLQTALVELGYSTGGVDGTYGPATEEAVRQFQRSSGLADDGNAGPATLAALAAALNER